MSQGGFTDSDSKSQGENVFIPGNTETDKVIETLRGLEKRSTPFRLQLDKLTALAKGSPNRKKIIDALYRLIISNPNLTGLSATNNNLNSAEASRIFIALRMHKAVATLDLSNNDINNEAACKECKVLLTGNHTLTSLNLSNNKISEGRVAMIAPPGSFAKDSALTHLDLSGNDLRFERSYNHPPDLYWLEDIVGAFSKLKELNFSNNHAELDLSSHAKSKDPELREMSQYIEDELTKRKIHVAGLKRISDEKKSEKKDEKKDAGRVTKQSATVTASGKQYTELLDEEVDEGSDDKAPLIPRSKIS